MNVEQLYELASMQARKDFKIIQSGPLPKNIITFGFNITGPEIIWYRNSGMAKLTFSKETEIKSKTYHLPTLVFHYSNKKLKVVASVENDPTLKTKAFYAPLSNISDDHLICMGTSTPDNDRIKTIKDLVESWEDGFIHGEFTHNTKNVTKNGDLKEFYKKGAPITSLKETKETIGTVFR